MPFEYLWSHSKSEVGSVAFLSLRRVFALSFPSLRVVFGSTSEGMTISLSAVPDESSLLVPPWRSFSGFNFLVPSDLCFRFYFQYDFNLSTSFLLIDTLENKTKRINVVDLGPMVASFGFMVIKIWDKLTLIIFSCNLFLKNHKIYGLIKIKLKLLKRRRNRIIKLKFNGFLWLTYCNAREDIKGC